MAWCSGSGVVLILQCIYLSFNQNFDKPASVRSFNVFVVKVIAPLFFGSSHKKPCLFMSDNNRDLWAWIADRYDWSKTVSCTCGFWRNGKDTFIRK